MTVDRVKVSLIVENQLPEFIKTEFPLVSEFLKEYYYSTDSQSLSSDLLVNIDKYIKLDFLSNVPESATLDSNVTIFDDSIPVVSTSGFPEKYGLIKINDEIILYKSKTETQFKECVRGFSGLVEETGNLNDDLIFQKSFSSDHVINSKVINVSGLCFKIFLEKIKSLISPGFENRDLNVDVNENLFIKQSIDFYSSKGSDESFKILFKALYGDDVKIIKPRDYILEPSSSKYRVTKDLIVEILEGNIFDLKNRTIFQDEDTNNEFTFASAPVSDVQIMEQGNDNYYILKLDYDFDKDIEVSGGSLLGEFSIHPKTKIIESISKDSSTLTVVSTLGFPESGELIYKSLETNQDVIVKYSSKNYNQFLDCIGIDDNLDESAELRINSYAYGYSNIETQEQIKFRISSISSDIKISNLNTLYEVGDEIKIESLGKIIEDDPRDANLFYNHRISYDISDIEVLSTSFRITTVDENNITQYDSITLLFTNNREYKLNVTKIESKTTFLTQLNSSLISPINNKEFLYIKTNIKRLNAINYPGSSSNITAIQDTFYDDENNLYISSTSLPIYPTNVKNIEFTLSGTFFSDIITISNHGFLTGDYVQYIKGEGENNVLSFPPGFYYVKVLDSNGIQLSNSRANLYAQKYVKINSSESSYETGDSVTGITTVTGQIFDNKLVLKKFANSTLSTQKLIRRITDQIDSPSYEIPVGNNIGILNDGVEVSHYKSQDSIFYGSIDKIEVLSGGEGYDVINPPQLLIRDVVGTGATGFCEVEGRLEKINIIDSGFDFYVKPEVKITGGNGSGASAVINLSVVENILTFNSSSNINVKLQDNIIAFSTYHRFLDGEKVIYDTQTQPAIVGLTTDKIYYVSVIDYYSIKLHNTYSDSLLKTNVVGITSYGQGLHRIKSFSNKNTIGSITITNKGSGYKSKRILVNFENVNVANNSFYAKNHNYKDKEIVIFTPGGSSIGGLTSGEKYYVKVLDDDNFRLVSIGNTTLGKEYYYNLKEYIEITSKGSGNHRFDYEPIEIEITGISSTTRKPELQPIFRGEIKNIFISNGGNLYGVNDIINYNRQPSIEVIAGSDADLEPLILDGKIQNVLIKNSGQNYYSPPDLIVIGDGVGCILTPKVKNGRIDSVVVNNTGIGYSKNKTYIVVKPNGSGSSFKAKVQEWRINEVERLIYQGLIVSDDGYIKSGRYGLQYNYLYSPRELRKISFAKKFIAGKLNYKEDLSLNSDGIEIDSDRHSPILGYAYDGNPIYGPYGFKNPDGTGGIKSLKSGYKQVSVYENNRPSGFPGGFFISDYYYNGDGDLDQHNGRFCVTPEYPNGVYAYFMTINETPESNSQSQFNKFKKPVFPYIIGESYKNTPDQFNFDYESDQSVFDPISNNLIKNTKNYGFFKNNTFYDYIKDPRKSVNEQLGIVNSSDFGEIIDFNILDAGENYKCGDKILISIENDKDPVESIEINSITGKEVNNILYINTTFDNIQLYPLTRKSFVGFSSVPIELGYNKNFNFVGLSEELKNSIGNKTIFPVNTKSSILILQSNLQTSLVTGDIAYIKVAGDLSFPNLSVDDILKIGIEKIKVLDIDRNKSILKIQRSYDGTVGVSHTISSVIEEIPRKFTVDFGIDYTTPTRLNYNIYFNPEESVSTGLVSGVGIGNTLNLPNVSVGTTQIFVPTKTIYLKNHTLETGDKLIYSPNGSGDPISISIDGTNSFDLNDNDILYAVKLTDNFIGLSTVKLSVGSGGTYIALENPSSIADTVYFSTVGTGNNHKFTTSFDDILTISLSKSELKVTTEENHELSVGDKINLNVISTGSTTNKVVYNDSNRRLILNPVTFNTGDVNITTNTINITDHNFITGDKVICKTNVPIKGTSSDSIYYVISVDKDKISLSEKYNESISTTKTPIDFISTFSGYIGKINPKLEIYKNSKVVFDLSDTSLSSNYFGTIISAFEFKLFSDLENNIEFLSSKDSNQFSVKKYGEVGITSDARVELSINENTPKNLFYSLSTVNNDLLSVSKKEYIIDYDNISDGSTIVLKNSLYNGNYLVSNVTDKTFSLPLTIIPEENQYLKINSKISYTTNSRTSKGSISGFLLNSFKKYYYKIPIISSIRTTTGYGAFLLPLTNNIGKINNIKIINYGFEYPSDITFRPTCIFPQTLDIRPLYEIGSVKVENIGSGYTIPHDLIVIDNYDNTLNPTIKLKYDPIKKVVDIVSNTQSLKGSRPILIPVNNENGVGISSATYDNKTQTVKLQLSKSYSDILDFPFQVNDQIYVENIINDGNNSFNSSDYQYNLFTITEIDPNIGGFLPTISYSLSSYLDEFDIVGEFLPQLSFGKVVNYKDFPKFIVEINYPDFKTGEKIFDDNSIYLAKVISWNKVNRTLKVVSNNVISNNIKIYGNSSGNISNVINNNIQKSEFILDSYSIVNNNWIDEKGFLNNGLQRLHDNFYYQYFSYAINSKISYDTWNDPVNSLIHPAGFKDFSELNIESEPTIVKADCNLVSGICTDQNKGYFEGISELTSTIDLECYPDFDLSKEISYDLSGQYVSNEIVFNSRILRDHFESIGNRVIEIQIPDDSSQVVGSNVQVSFLDEFNVNDKKYKKYIVFTQLNSDEDIKQISLLSAAHDKTNSFVNEYATLSTYEDIIGNYSLDINYNNATLKFEPKDNINYSPIDFSTTVVSFDINTISGISTLSLGSIVNMQGFHSNIGIGSTQSSNVISIEKNTIRSGKLLVGISSEDNNFLQINELTFVVNDYISSSPTDPITINLLDYGKIVTGNDYPIGLGTYSAYYDSSDDNIKINFIPDSSIPFDVDVDTSCIIFSNHNSVSTGSTQINTGKLNSYYTDIPISTTENTVIAQYTNTTEFSAYLIVTIENKSNNHHQVSELVVLTDTKNDDVNITEYGSVFKERLGYFSAQVSGDITSIIFTPIVLDDLECRSFVISLGEPNTNSSVEEINLGNISISGSNIFYGGYSVTLNRSFELYNNFQPIFRRTFDASDPRIVSIANSSIYSYDHNFSTGEKLKYYYENGNIPIKINPTNIPGIGVTDILPSEVYAVKLNKSQIRLAASAEDALKPIPNILPISSVGIGSTHTLLATKQNEKCLITIDNVIQSPLSKTKYFTYCDGDVNDTQTLIKFTGIGSIFTGDLVKIDDEFLLIDDVGIGTDLYLCRVRRNWMNTGIQTHSSNSEVRKYSGNYNIHRNILTFVGDIIKDVPVETNDPDEVDFSEIQTSSSFYGRVFLRSGIIGSSSTTYANNYVFDDISSEFKNIQTDYLLKSDEKNISDINEFNGGIILIKDVYQLPRRLGTPDIEGSYYFGESGIGTIYFTGSKNSQTYDINSFSLPVGGVIQSVKSFEGSGYRPLVCAGGTAIINLPGVLQGVSVESYGSGYRENIQPLVNVKIISSSSTEKYKTITVGFANIVDGKIDSVTINNPVSNLDPNNPPKVLIDDPLPYSNIPLIYSSSSPNIGVGTEATVDLIVSQDGSIQSFNIKNYGYSYDNLEILTIPIDDGYGIPTDQSNFNEFTIEIEKVYNDKFSGWTMGEFTPLDNIENLFNSQRKTFPLSIDSEIYPITTKMGSSIDLKMTLLVFINNILQRPDIGYTFEGGSFITFSEPPKKGDRCEIVFYKGTPGVDVVFKDITESIEIGDNVRLESSDIFYNQDFRNVKDIKSIDSIITNPYSGPGISSDFNIERPIIWCKQRDDIVSSDGYITKDRAIYEPNIHPSTKIISGVGVGSTHIFVDSLLPFFYNKKENISNEKSRSIQIVSNVQPTQASATAVLNASGILTSFIITNQGYAYSSPPELFVDIPVGIAASFRPVLKSNINILGKLTSIDIISSPIEFSSIPSVTIQPPQSLVETIDDVFYQGDYGTIVGISTTSVSEANKGIIFQLQISSDSLLKDDLYSYDVVNTSQLKKNYYFKVFNSNIGSGVTSLDKNGNTVSVGSSYLDNVYKVIDTFNIDNIINSDTTVIDISEFDSPTQVADSISLTIDDGAELTINEFNNLEVLVSVSDYNGLISDISTLSSTYIGDYSWGRIIATKRTSPKNFDVGFDNNFSNLNNNPTLWRKNSLAYKFYNK
jgi:hypothetical protein